jgi:uncharacterized protein YjaZ
MGIVRTDEWLKEKFDSPIDVCKKLVPYFNEQSATSIYSELMNYGMYKPSKASYSNLNFMIQQGLWKKIEHIFLQYKQKWSGPDIPIFIFPLAQSGGFFFRQDNVKSGVSYPDKMFLFVSKLEDLKELEALFVHEYHHVCRLRKINKNMKDYTLLDSLIFEGLAEYAVLKNCGKNYLAKWCKRYSKKELLVFWNAFLKEYLELRKSEPAHEKLLYGGGKYPILLGYAVGFAIVEYYYNDKKYNSKLSFSLPASEFIANNREFHLKNSD